jgi:hypothetical protein
MAFLNPVFTASIYQPLPIDPAKEAFLFDSFGARKCDVGIENDTALVDGTCPFSIFAVVKVIQ